LYELFFNCISLKIRHQLQRRINNELRLTEQNEIKNGHIRQSGEQEENYQGTRRTESTGERATKKAIRATPTSTSTPRTTRPNEATVNKRNKPRTVSKLGVEGNIFDTITRHLQEIDNSHKLLEATQAYQEQGLEKILDTVKKLINQSKVIQIK